jgi:ribosomal protein S18 acetylase RimI-like enzyme
MSGTLRIEPVEDDAGLGILVALRAAVDGHSMGSVADVRHTRTISTHPLHLVAWLEDEPAGFANGSVFPGTERESYLLANCGVLAERRRRGIGTALLSELSDHARSVGKAALRLEVREDDQDSLAFYTRRGFVEVERQKEVSLELGPIDAAPPEPPPGIELTTRAERPEVFPSVYEVAAEAFEDMPGEEGFLSTFEQWLAFENRPSRRPELTLIALAGEEPVGYAALDVFGAGVFHGLTAVKRSWRRRGVATALKRAQIHAAKEAGFERLVTESEERNLPMRRLNEKLGYLPDPGLIVLLGPLLSAGALSAGGNGLA